MERQRQTVPIAGINRAENDLTVQDGCCETLHNLRYDAGHGGMSRLSGRWRK